MSVEIPGTLGGGNWSGSSFDPTLDYLFASVSEVGAVGFMQAQPTGANKPTSAAASGEIMRASGMTTIIPASSLPGAT